MAYEVIITMEEKSKQKTYEQIYGMTRAKMSTVMNEGVKISFKVVTTQLFTVVGLLVEISTAIEKSKGSIVAYPSIR